MKIFRTLFIVISCVSLLSACGKGNEIAGRSQTSVSKSARYLKERLPANKRLEFEVSFFTIRDAYKDKDSSEFLKAVDGKTPDEIIEMGKSIYTERKQAGIAEYSKYATWDDMIKNFSKERSAQGSKPMDAREKQARPTLYKL